MTRTTFALTLILLSLALAGCGKNEEAKAATPPPEPLPADVKALQRQLQPSGVPAGDGAPFVATGEFVSPVRSDVAAKIIGRVAQVFVEEGQRVERGQPLLVLETDYLRLNLQAAEAEAARTKAMFDEAQRDLARKKELIAKSSIPQATFDRTQAAYDQARAAHQAASAQAALLRQQIADSTVRSPITGVIASKRAEVGEKLGDGAVAFVVAQVSPLKLRFSVPERYLGKIGRGDKVTARVDPYPNEAFEGAIRMVGGVIDPATRTFFAEAEFQNRDGRLRPGLFARVEANLESQ
jgi:RND family efflux transporter MFP subunit